MKDLNTNILAVTKCVSNNLKHNVLCHSFYQKAEQRYYLSICN